MKVESIFRSVRWMHFAPIAGGLVGAMVAFYQGVRYIIDAVLLLLPTAADEPPPVDISDSVTLALLEAVDSFLFGSALVLFAFGTFHLFHHKPVPESRLPRWIRIEHIGELKNLLVEIIVVILFVVFLKKVVALDGEVTLQNLILPGAILLLSASVRLLDLSHHWTPTHGDAPAPRAANAIPPKAHQAADPHAADLEVPTPATR